MNTGKIENTIDVSVVMPCLNEEQAVGLCIKKCLKVFRENNIKGEIIVVDNGSTDKSREIILESGAKLVDESRKGYGSAYLKGFSEAQGKCIVMGDADNTYDFLDIPSFLKPLKEGYDFVIGSRLKGDIKMGKGTMPFLHRYVGNPILTFILRKLFDINVSDAHCGMRSLKKESYHRLNMKTIGMEFASEMIINARKANLKTKEIPISYNLRQGESKLRTFKDGWRHLRFMLLYSPNFVFLIPGAFLFITGFVLDLILVSGPVLVWGKSFDFHFMFIGSLFLLTGYQIANLGFFAKTYAYSEKFADEKDDKLIKFLSQKVTLERMIFIGSAVFFAGFFILGSILFEWIGSGYGELFEVRKMILSVTFMIIGIQIVFNGFYYSILKLK